MTSQLDQGQKYTLPYKLVPDHRIRAPWIGVTEDGWGSR